MGSCRQKPRFGEHRHQHNAQCAKKPLLRLREPESAAAAETRRTKPHNSGMLCADLKLVKDDAKTRRTSRELLGQIFCASTVSHVRKSGKVLCKDAGTQTHAEVANLELSGAKRLAWAAFGSSRALESTATGTMLSARRSRFFASGSRTARPLLRPEERSRTTVACSAQTSNSSRTVPFQSPTFKTHKDIPVEGGFAQLG
ncbi:unnamed protein product [Coccothraustes coccothraustes]